MCARGGGKRAQRGPSVWEGGQEGITSRHDGLLMVGPRAINCATVLFFCKPVMTRPFTSNPPHLHTSTPPVNQ